MVAPLRGAKAKREAQRMRKRGEGGRKEKKARVRGKSAREGSKRVREEETGGGRN